jgi:hypothetical protein
MNNETHDSGFPADELDRWVQDQQPPEPSSTFLERCLASIPRATADLRETTVDPQGPMPLTRRILTMKNVTISAGVLSTAAAVLLMVALTPSSPTLADAIRSIQNAHIVSYSALSTSSYPGQPLRVFTRKVYLSADGSSRSDASELTDTAGGRRTIEIYDMSAGKRACLYEASKRAEVRAINKEDPLGTKAMAKNKHIHITYSGCDVFVPDHLEMTTSSRWLQMLENLRKAAEKPVKVLGEKTIGDRKVKGFVVLGDDEPQKVVVWIDAVTGQPVQIEETSTGQPVRVGGTSYPNDLRITNLYFDFQVNPKGVDESIFKADVPEGYTLVK